MLVLEVPHNFYCVFSVVYSLPILPGHRLRKFPFIVCLCGCLGVNEHLMLFIHRNTTINLKQYTFIPLCILFAAHKKPVVKISEQQKTIEAQDRSPVTLFIGDNVTALTNTSITIQCPTSGVPTPTVTWTKDGEQITNDGRYTVQDDGSLLIEEADEQVSDRYTCTASSVAGKDSALSTVNIVGKVLLVFRFSPKPKCF